MAKARKQVQQGVSQLVEAETLQKKLTILMLIILAGILVLLPSSATVLNVLNACAGRWQRRATMCSRA